MFDIKKKIAELAEKDATLKETLAELAENKPKLTDLLESDKIKAFIRKIAMFLIAIRDKYLAEAGVTEEELIKKAAEYLDDKVTLPWYLEPVDGPIFAWALQFAMNSIEKAAEDQQQVAALMSSMDSMTA